jgi:F-type H+-transporting ATPase subunit b
VKKFGFSLPVLALVLLALSMHPMRLRAQTQSAQPAATQLDATKQADSEKEEPDENDQYMQSDNVKMFGHMMHMEPSRASIVFEVLNFAVLAGLLGWALLRALPRIFSGRVATIQKQIVDARTVTQQANTRLAEVEHQLSRLDSEIASLQSRIEHEAGQEQVRIQVAMEAEKQRIVTASEQEINAATALAQRQLKQFAAGLAIEQAARKIAINAETDRQMVEEFAASLTGSGTSGGKN